jgi:hypothetical protein
VHHPALVGNTECSCHIEGNLGGPTWMKGPCCTENLRERLTVHILHDDVVGTALGAPVIDAHDVWVCQIGCRLCLPTKPLDERRVGGEFWEQHLDRNWPIERAIARQEHLGHSTTREAPVDFVAAAENDGLWGVRGFGRGHGHFHNSERGSPNGVNWAKS